MNPKDRLNRFSALHEIGCIVCKLYYDCYTEPCIHHLTGIQYRGMGKRAADSDTLPLCPRHHQYGNNMHPSIHGQPALFKEAFGTQDELLLIVNELIQKISPH